jgi:chromosome segregation ATPase
MPTDPTPRPRLKRYSATCDELSSGSHLFCTDPDVAALEAERDSLIARADALEAEVARLHKCLDDAIDEGSMFRDAAGRAQSAHFAKSQELEKANRHLDALEEDRDALQADLTACERKLSAALERVVELKGGLREVKRQGEINAAYNIASTLLAKKGAADEL